LGVILSFFGGVDWFKDVLCPAFLLEYVNILYYACFAAVGAVVGYFGKH
jgi:hypothetical protein